MRDWNNLLGVSYLNVRGIHFMDNHQTGNIKKHKTYVFLQVLHEDEECNP